MADEVNSAAPPMHQWATDLFPIHRSLTGDGVRQTLSYLTELLPNLAVHEVPSGTKAFDWTVPKEWVCREAYIGRFDDEPVVDLRKSNLHVVQYSAPFNGWVTGEELDNHLHSLPEQPDATETVRVVDPRTDPPARPDGSRKTNYSSADLRNAAAQQSIGRLVRQARQTGPIADIAGR